MKVVAVNLVKSAPKIQPFSGLWGNMDYYLLGGDQQNGFRYNKQGEAVGLAYNMLTFPDFSKSGLSYKSLLKLLDPKNWGKTAALLKAAKKLDRNGLTAAGRALQKHGSGSSGKFPKATGNAASINQQAEKVLESIISHPDAATVTRHHARFGNIMEITTPGGQGARFSTDGRTFIGFIDK